MAGFDGYMDLMALVSSSWWPPPDSTSWAAWVQGVGTVLAVFVAVGSLIWQQRQLRGDIQRRQQQFEAGVGEQRKTQARAISGWVRYPRKISFEDNEADVGYRRRSAQSL